MTFERKGSRGGSQARRRRPARGERLEDGGPSSAEWKACEVCRRRPSIPRAAEPRRAGRRPPRPARRPRRAPGALTAARASSGPPSSGAQLRLGQRHGEHGARRQRLHQPAALRHQAPARPPARRRRPGRRPRTRRGCGRASPPGAPPRTSTAAPGRTRRRRGPAGRAAVRSSRRAASPPSAGRRIEQLAQVEPEVRRRSSSAQRSSSRAEDRLALVEAARHAGVLRALAGEEEGDRAARPASGAGGEQPARDRAPPRAARGVLGDVAADQRPGGAAKARRARPAGCRRRRPGSSSGVAPAGARPGWSPSAAPAPSAAARREQQELPAGRDGAATARGGPAPPPGPRARWCRRCRTS